MLRLYNAYFSTMHKADYEGTLFGELDWRDMRLPEERSVKQLSTMVENLIRQSPGESRDSIWLNVITSKFMQYPESQYLKVLTKLAQEKK